MKKAMAGLSGLYLALLPVCHLYASGGLLLGIVVFLCLGSLCFCCTAELSLSYTDLLLVLFCLWAVANACFIRRAWVDPDRVLLWGTVLFLYLLVRLQGAPKIILTGVVVGGVIQLVIVALQWYGVLVSHHPYHDFTGSFANPGPLGGYLAAAGICALGSMACAWKNQRRKVGVLYALAFLFLSFGVVLSDSRAAWLGLTVGACYIVSRHWRPEFTGYYRKIVRFTLPILAVAGVFFLYRYKKDSTDGRLLIWNVSGTMIAEKPLMGHGLAAFPEQYMYHQADYFASHPGSRYTSVADNVSYPFNEGIGVTVELGSIGLCLAIFVWLSAFQKPCPTTARLDYRAILWTWLAFGSFSYPSQVLPLAALAAVGLAGANGRIWKRYPPTGWLKGVGCGLMLTALVGWYAYGQSPRVQLYSRQYLRHYVKRLMLRFDPENLSEIESLARRIPATEVFTELGKLQHASGRDRDAARSFELAHRMVPNRILPLYEQFNLCLKMHELARADSLAGQIRALPVKLPNTTTIRIKAQMEQRLNNQN